MPTVICRRPVTYSGKRYTPGDIFDIDDKYIDEVSKCCEHVTQCEDNKHEDAKPGQDSVRPKSKKASK